MLYMNTLWAPHEEIMKKYAPEGIVSENIFGGFASWYLKFGALPQMVLLPNPLLAVLLTPNDP